MKPFIYVASPYSNQQASVRQQRFDMVCKYTANLICCGNIAFSPIAHSHNMAEALGIKAHGFSFWEDLDVFLIERCDILHVLCLPDWEVSGGVAKEIEKANELGKPIVYIPWGV
ncbi:MAG: hypothetical protein COA94_04840 [Rickettsiales bacterium]|nr:MAG: hypothetical protein COA94_04840 [Rickettsiales bacterium]